VTQSNITGVSSTLNETGRNYLESIGRLAELTGTIGQGVERIGDAMGARIEELTNILKAEVSGMKSESKASLDNIQMGVAKFEELLNQSAVSLASITALTGEMNKSYIESVGRISGLAEGISSKIDDLSGAIKSELASLKTEVTAPVAGIQSGVMKFEELFDRTQSNIGNMSDMMSNLNKNYIESLSKIAGLAEGMRKGVESVGADMHSSAKDLVGEMKKEIGALEKQYEKTFGDIGKLAERFEELNRQIAKMTHEVQREFKGSFERQSELSAFTSDIVKHIKEYFDKEDARYKEEQAVRQKKEALDHFDRATLYYYRGNYELALNEVDKAMEKEKLAEYMNLKGLLLTELGRADEAKRTYLEALKMEPNLAEIYNNLGLLYLKTKKLNDAVSSFQEAIKRNVNYSLAYVHLGKALIEQERFDEAMNAYEKALEIDPANKAAREAIELYKEGKVSN
jgi:Flp pilus assembly protein TadD